MLETARIPSARYMLSARRVRSARGHEGHVKREGMESMGCTNSALGSVNTEGLESLENVGRAEAMGSAVAM